MSATEEPSTEQRLTVILSIDASKQSDAAVQRKSQEPSLLLLRLSSVENYRIT